MKKIFSIALAATLLAAGCQKTEVIGTSTTGSKMTFSTEMKKITKAGEGTDETPYTGELPDGNANLQANGFNIWAYADYDLAVNSNNVDPETRIYDGMAGDLIKYNSNAWAHVNNKEYYWPAEKRNLMFFAVSAQDGTFPKGQDGKISNVTPKHGINAPYPSSTQNPDFTGAKLEINNFVVKNTATAATENKPAIPVASNDLMVANFRNQNSGTQSEAVDLKFNHALTKVQFVFSTTIDPYYKKDEQNKEGEVQNGGELKEDGVAPRVYVQKVEVKDLLYTGNLTVTPTGNVTPDDNNAFVSNVSLTWEVLDDETQFTATWPNEGTAFPTSFEKIGTTDGKLTPSSLDDKKSLLLTDQSQTFTTWFMLPQTLAGKLVTITYVINERQFSAMFPLEGSTDNNKITAWGVNQYVKYNITLTPDMILFGATVSEWTPQIDDTLQD